MTEQARTLARLLRAAAAAAPSSEAIVAAGRRTTYGDFDHQVDVLASALLAAGLQRGDRVAAWLSNREEFLHVYLACCRLGLVFVPINTRLSPTEVVDILDRSGASLLILEEVFDDRNRRLELPELARKLREPGLLVSLEGEADGAVAFETLLDAHDEDAVAAFEASVEPDDVAIVIYTSGTTGKPKGVAVTHRGLTAYARAAARVRLFEPGDRVLIQVPLAVAAGSIIQTAPVLAVGATLVLLDVFKARPSLELIEAERVTCCVAPPAILTLQLRVPDFDNFDLSSLRHLITGAAPVPAELAAEVIERMDARLTNSYGATETGGLATYLPEGAPPEAVVSTSGVAIPGYELRIVGDDREDVPTGKIGELAVRGPSVMAGYFGDEEETSLVLDANGWWYSGDLGTIDADGYLRIVGRKKEMYIRGGFNVYPAEVEAVLQRHPDVVVAAVTGFEDPVLGEKGRAFVVVRAGHELTVDAVMEFCNGALADYKVPDEVVFLEKLPLLGPGKVDRRALRELAASLVP